ncbi:MAG: peptide ABC transporter substrate-binding protein [Chloroflexota bacterium]
MLKGYRGPALALLAAVILLGLVLATRPTVDLPAVTTATAAQVIQVIPATATLLPTLTPAPTIPFQQLDTSALNEALVGCIKKLNPLLAGYNQADLDVTSLIFEGLMTTDAHGSAVPDLAAAPPAVSRDGLIYAVKLRTDVLWQDGLPFTSADVIFTINLMQDAGFTGRTDLRNFWQTVEVEAIDEHTVRFTLAQPLAAFPDYLRIGILPEHALKGTPASHLSSHPFNLSPIGTGPYQFDGLIGSSSQITGVRLRFAATYNQRPEGKDGYALRQIVFHCEPSFNDAIAAFQRGDVNTVSQLPADILQQTAALTQLNTYSAYPPAFGAVVYNWQRDEVNFFRDFRMRQALARSVDRAALVNKYLAGRAVVADNPILPSSWAYTKGVSCPSYDPKDPNAAKTLLSQVQAQPVQLAAATAAATSNATADAAPPAAPAAPTTFQFQLLTSNDPALAGMATDIAKTWTALGVQVNTVVVDPLTFKERLTAGNFDAALVELDLAPSADPDPYSLWRQIPADGGLNFGGMNERRLSEMVEAARREVNGVYRAELYHNFQKLFCDRAAALLLYYPVYFYGADSRLAGIQLGFMSDPSSRFRTIHDWRFVQQP